MNLKFFVALIQIAFSFSKPLDTTGLSQTQYLTEHIAVWVEHPTLKKPDGSAHRRTCFTWPDDKPYDAGPPPAGCPDMRQVFCWDSQTRTPNECVMAREVKAWLHRDWILPTPDPVPEPTPQPTQYSISEVRITNEGNNPPSLAITTDAPISTEVGKYHFHISVDAQAPRHVYNKQPQIPGGPYSVGQHSVRVILSDTVEQGAEHVERGVEMTVPFTIQQTAPVPSPTPTPEPTPTATVPPPVPSGWKVLWQDLMDAQAGSPPDSRWWIVENEKDFDTTKTYFLPKNIAHDGKGALVITAIKETTPEETRTWSSAQIRSVRRPDQKKFSFGLQDYKVQFAVSMDYCLDCWSAGWGQGEDWVPGSWPGTGEWDGVETNLYRLTDQPGKLIFTSTSIATGASGFPHGKIALDPTKPNVFEKEYDHEGKQHIYRANGLELIRKTSVQIPSWPFDDRKQSLIFDLSLFRRDSGQGLTQVRMWIHWARVLVRQ